MGKQRVLAHALIVALLSMLLSVATAVAQDGVAQSPPARMILTDAQAEYPLGLHVELLEDPSGQLTIDDVSGPTYAQRFVPSQEVVPNFGLTRSAIWVRFRVRNEDPQNTDWRLEVALPGMNYIDLYRPTEDGRGFSAKRVGLLLPFAAREVAHHHYVFKLPLAQMQEQTYYLRFETGVAMLLPLTLWSAEALAQKTQIDQFVAGLFYGMTLIMLGYNFFLFLVLRERSYLALVGLITTRLLLTAALDGRAMQFLWPQVGAGNRFLYSLLLVLFFSTLLCFTALFLETKRRAPRWHTLILLLQAGLGVLLLLMPFVTYHLFATLALSFVLLVSPTTLGAGLAVWRRGYRPARYFLLAELLSATAITVELLIRFNLLPAQTFLGLNEHWSMALRVLFLSLALADRIHLLQADIATTHQQLDEREALLRSIIDNSTAVIYVKRLDGRYLLINRQYAELFKVDPTQIDDKTDADIFPPTVAAAFRANDLQVIQAGRPLQTEETAPHADGLHTYVSVKFLLFDASGQPYAICGISTDITERNRFEQEIRQLNTVLEQRVADRNRELAALYDVTAVASEALDLPTMLTRSLASVLAAMRSQAGAIHLLDEDGQMLRLAIQQGVPTELAKQISHLTVNTPVLYKVAAGGEPWIIPDLAADPSTRNLPLGQFQALALVPMHAGGQVLGMVSIARMQGQPPFNVEATALLMTIADVVGVVVESARLRQRAGQVAVMEERARLARELHDSVTQLLYSLNLFARAGETAYRQTNLIAVEQCLRELSAIAQQAFREMRLLVYELRPPSVQQAGLVGALQLRLEAVEKRAGIGTELLAPASVLELAAPLEDALYCIAQEALNNALKHASASQVTVRLAVDNQGVELAVIDNGSGFDPQALADQGGLGLTTMRERAEQVGGVLTIQSAPGTGATITVRVKVEASL